jgi:hypothetical protein
MYAVELCLTVDAGSIAPSQEAVEASIRQNSKSSTARIEHLELRRIGGELYVVTFVAARTARDAEDLAAAVGTGVATEFRHVSFSRFRVWTDDQFRSKGAEP